VLILWDESNKGRLLMVDDEIDTAQTLGRILETSGFEVDIFTDPKAALGRFNEGYDLAAIDVRMPDMNGFELYSETFSHCFKGFA
jgi:two-component system C4-dicarboxylate transport response regulator DctD